MSAVLIAVFSDHAAAEAVRTQLVKDGFPTDRVQLTSLQELGRAKVVPKARLATQLAEYFRKLLQTVGDERSVHILQRAVLGGKGALAVQPRGEIEMRRALQLLNEGGAVDLRGADLQNAAFEHAATETETPVLTWMGKVLAAPGASDTTGTPTLP